MKIQAIMWRTSKTWHVEFEKDLLGENKVGG
jgi:hypothetical protein